MEEEILDSWKIFHVFELERSSKVLEQGTLAEISRREKLCLLGLVDVDKVINKKAFIYNGKSLLAKRES